MRREITERQRRRRRRKIKNFIIKAAAIFILICMLTLMWCGCLYIYGLFKKDEASEALAQTAVLKKPESGGVYSEKPRVVIDVGHGGKDPGTESFGAMEKNINLAVALKLKAALEESGAEVIMTRSSDKFLSLEERVSIANSARADCFVSLHCNYYEEDAQIFGLECYYNSALAGSQALSLSIINAAKKGGIATRNSKQEDYYVLRNAEIPAVLVEMGFMSSFSECKSLTDTAYQKLLAQQIAKGIIESLNIIPT